MCVLILASKLLHPCTSAEWMYLQRKLARQTIKIILKIIMENANDISAYLPVSFRENSTLFDTMELKRISHVTDSR